MNKNLDALYSTHYPQPAPFKMLFLFLEVHLLK